MSAHLVLYVRTQDAQIVSAGIFSERSPTIFLSPNEGGLTTICIMSESGPFHLAMGPILQAVALQMPRLTLLLPDVQREQVRLVPGFQEDRQ